MTDSSPYARARAWLRALTGSEEVDRDPRLKLICGVLLGYFLFTFQHWWQSPEPLSTVGYEQFDYAPAALVYRLGHLGFLGLFATQTYLYVLGMVALLGIGALALRASSLAAMLILGFLWINKLYFYLCDFRLFTNYHHFHLFFTAAFLLATDKLRMFRGALAVCYWMSAITKISPSWLLGEYFNSVPGKLPLFPQTDAVVTAAGIAVFVMELVGPFVWFGRSVTLKRVTFALLLVFHFYSGLIVGFWYTTLMLPLAAAAFLGFREPLFAGYRFARRHLAVFALFAAAIGGGLLHLVIPGDARLTGEARYFGSFMFDANRAARFTVGILRGEHFWVVRVDRPYRGLSREPPPQIVAQRFRVADGRLLETFPVNAPIRDGDTILFNPRYFTRARVRMYGDPYLYFFFARELVRRARPDRVELRLEARIDGHEEWVTLLNIEDFAALNPSYHPFGRNEWILLPGPDAPSSYRWP